MKNKSDFANLRGKKILVTGHTGFKGSWLSLWLHKLGAEVHGFALREENGPATYSALGLSQLLKSEALADIAIESAFANFYEKVKPDFCFHLAAQALVRRSYAEPLRTIQSNILGTTHVLESLRRHNAPGLIVTSDKCYENREVARPYREDDAMGGHDIYSMSKGACELVTAAYRKSFDMNIATARAGNVIGGGDFSEDRIIPDCVRAVRNKKAMFVRNPASVRPWQHVLEPVSGYLTLANVLLSPQATTAREGWNFGPANGDTVPVKDLVERFYSVFGKYPVEYGSAEFTQAQHEAKLLYLDIGKAQTRLGWQPAWNIDTALNATSRWYRNFESANNKVGSMRDFSLEQIIQYEEAR